jgi:hypothetical protein
MDEGFTWPAHAYITGFAGVPGDVWAVTSGGLGHWNGGAWELHGERAAAGTLNAVWGASADDVWAVGANATVVRRRSGAWKRVEVSPGWWTFSSVHGSGPDDVWVLGADGDGGSALLHCGSSGCVDQSLPSGINDAAAVWAAAPGDLWLVTRAGLVLRGDGQSWQTPYQVPSATFGAMWGTAPDDLWLVGTSTLVHWDGASFQSYDAGQDELGSVSGTAGDDVWAVGTRDYYSVILRWDGSSWSTIATTDVRLSGVHAVARDKAWAVGAGILSWDGTSWFTEVDLHGTGTGDFGSLLGSGAGNAVWAPSPTDVYVAGSAILRQVN